MKKLIPQLKKEHELILSMITDVGRLGINSKAGAKKLLQTKHLLLAHLNREDKDLYPCLNEMAASDQTLRELLNDLSNDMINLANKALDFFDKYTDVDDIDADFENDAQQIFTALKKRIEREENHLYPHYQ